MSKTIKTNMLFSILIFVGKILLALIAATILYGVMSLMLSWLPLNRKFKNDEEGIDIFIISNGVHVDFLLPIEKLGEELSEIIKANDYGYPKEEIKYIGFGWGDRGFYLEIENWSDMTLKVGFNALFLPSPTLMHLTAYNNVPTEKKECEKLTISSTQFAQLSDYIFNSFYRDKSNQFVFIADKGYTPYDNFYEAKGAYHMFNTCNFWVNRGLQIIGIRTSIWSPFAKGIFYHLKKVNEVEDLNVTK